MSRPIRSASLIQNHFGGDNASTNLEHLCELKVGVKAMRMRKTGIICTVGPACGTLEKVKQMIKNGMNIARLNFSHGNHEMHSKSIAMIREAAKQSGDAVIAIALDTKGPEIRTGLLAAGTDVELRTGESIRLTTDPGVENHGTGTELYVDYERLPSTVSKGSKIFIDDGLISLRVDEFTETDVLCTIENGGMLGNRKGVNLPGTTVDLPAVTQKDREDFVFGMEQQVDIIFASFIRDGNGIREIRKHLGERGKNIKIIAKIESEQGVLNADEIIKEADGIMVARGDLGIEIAPEKVFLAQKMLSAKCNLAGKPVICATQMLESMIHKPRPTRAECSDVANAVLDGVDCVMLSGETAKGEYPLEALKMMHFTCKEAETAFYHSRYLNELVENTKQPTDITNTIAIAAVTAITCNFAKAIICITTSGATARLCSRYKPPVPIITVCRKPLVARQLHLCRSVFPVVFQGPVLEDMLQDMQQRINYGVEHGKKLKCLNIGDQIIVITGWRHGEGSTNTMRIMFVE